MFSYAPRLGRAVSTIPFAAAVSLVASCSSGGADATTVAVTATDSDCSVDRASVPAGPVRISVQNHGSSITEVYLLAEHDRIVDEVENVEPGDSAEFTVTPGGGHYAVNCKPGQLGEGFRAPFEIAGPAVAASDVDRATARGIRTFAVQVSIADDGFGAQFDDLVVVSGQTVTFGLTNAGAVAHSIAVVGPDGVTELGRSTTTQPGATTSVEVTFTATGRHTVIDPQAAGLTATFEVIK